jgi:hypothetical protein
VSNYNHLKAKMLLKEDHICHFLTVFLLKIALKDKKIALKDKGKRKIVLNVNQKFCKFMIERLPGIHHSAIS